MVSKRFSQKVQIPARLGQWVANRLVSAHLRSLKVMLLCHMLNVAIMGAVMWGKVPQRELGLFAILLLSGFAHRFYLAEGLARHKQRSNPEGMAFALTLNSLFVGVCFSALFWVMIPQAMGIDQAVLAVSAVTLIATTAFTQRTLPRSALMMILLVAAGLIGGFLRTGAYQAIALGVMVAASAALLSHMVLVTHRAFVTRILRESELNDSMSTVRMLLNDFESHGSDWLFELDGQGNMQDVNARFAEAAGATSAQMEGQPFLGLFKEGREYQQLADNLRDGHGFRNMTLKLAGSDRNTARWWSVTGRLVPALAGRPARFRGVICDVSTEKQAELRVRHMAHYDSLTELPNRMMFTNSISRMVTERHKKSRLALLLIDFDHFKTINDMYGHPTGDAFLRWAGSRIADLVTESKLGGEGGMVARLGGDEFAVMVVGNDAADHSARLAQLLVDSFAEPTLVNGHEVASGVSIGIALNPDHAATADHLLSLADIALYSAKEEGRGCWEMFTAGMDDAVHKRHGIARDLRTAVANGELRLFLQPLVDVETGNSTGYEALLRWEHPERGLVMPDDFIPVAEETGLIVPMGEWVIRTALAEAARWNEPRSIAINLSPLQLRSSNLIPTLVNALAETGIDAGRVELEITETVLMHDSAANILMLNRLHALGVKIALDDFGTGYASLNYLLTFPFDKIKIDRSFVTDLENREEAQAIVGAVIRLANQLGMCTLAEGVEHEGQLASLRDHGCEMVQGWLFGKAMPAEHYATLRLQEEAVQAQTVALPKRKAA